MLSHNARIEAAYGGTMLADMQQVAGRIEEIMNLTISYLKQLTTTMKMPELIRQICVDSADHF